MSSSDDIDELGLGNQFQGEIKRSANVWCHELPDHTATLMR